MKKLLIFLSLIIAFSSALAEDFSLEDMAITPQFNIISPDSNHSYSNGGKLQIKTSGQFAGSYKISLKYDNMIISKDYVGENIDAELSFEPHPHPMTLEITAYRNDDFTGVSLTKSIEILSPKDELIGKMIALAFENSTDKKYMFAPAEEDHQIGVCKNFVMRLFDTFSKDYRMQAYPDLVLHMPKNRSLKDSKPYQYGLEWRIESAEDGSPFEIVEQFKYNRDISKEENYKDAFHLMTLVKKGDFFQMVGDYGGGNGPHSLYFIEDYNPASDTLHWTDSNMYGKRIDGVRWGYMQYDAVKTGDWFANVFNMKDRGATIYRLRDDLIKP